MQKQNIIYSVTLPLINVTQLKLRLILIVGQWAD